MLLFIWYKVKNDIPRYAINALTHALEFEAVKWASSYNVRVREVQSDEPSEENIEDKIQMVIQRELSNLKEKLLNSNGGAAGNLVMSETVMSKKSIDQTKKKHAAEYNFDLKHRAGASNTIMQMRY